MSELDMFCIHMYNTKKIFKSPGLFIHPLQNMHNYQSSDSLEGGCPEWNLLSIKQHGVCSYNSRPFPDYNSK